MYLRGQRGLGTAELGNFRREVGLIPAGICFHSYQLEFHSLPEATNLHPDSHLEVPSLLDSYLIFQENFKAFRMAAFEEEVSSSGMKQSSFPQNPEEFDADPRVSFSKVSNKFVLETDDGQEFEYDDALRRWISVVRQCPLEILDMKKELFAPFTRWAN